MNTMYRDNDKTDSASEIHLHCHDPMTPLDGHSPRTREISNMDMLSSRHFQHEDLVSTSKGPIQQVRTHVIPTQMNPNTMYPFLASGRKKDSQSSVKGLEFRRWKLIQPRQLGADNDLML